MQRLREQVSGYVAELNQLREENALLTDANQNLTAERDNLQTDLDAQVATHETLNQERAVLVSERQQLTQVNNELNRKVTQASAIGLTSIEAVGEKVRRSGKAVTRRDAANVEHIRISFNTEANQIANPGTEEFFVRIVSAAGETLADNTMGSGVFTSQETGKQIRYTMKDDLAYDQTENSVQMRWKPGQQFQAGRYEVEVYNKGYLVGTTSLVLR